jgi:phospholipid transport system substrate-binding protein
LLRNSKKSVLIITSVGLLYYAKKEEVSGVWEVSVVCIPGIRNGAEKMNMVRQERSVSVAHWVVGSLILLHAVLFPLQGNAASAGPAEVIKTFNAALLESMKRADELGYSGRFKLLDPVIRNSFALSYMASQSLGRYWKTIKETQQSALVKTYTEWSIATYARRFDGYSGERFEVVSESPSDQGTVTVISRIIQPNKEGAVFHYKLRKIDGNWRIVDIQISGVSQLALTRSQFTSVIKEKGFDGLIALLKSKTESLAQGKL